MRYKSEIKEVQQRFRRHHGYKMKTSASGRRYRAASFGHVPTGAFYGEIFYEEQKTQTGDWGDGLETKTFVTRDVVVTIAPNTDRALVERRTKLLLDAMNEEALEAETLSADADEASYEHFNRYIAGDR
jgi:hypothetical protein